MTDMSYSPAVAVAPTQAAAPTGPVSTPLKLGIPIPGVSFDQSLQQANGYTAAPFIAQYVAGIERYLISIAVIAAGIMLVVGGFFYTSSTAKGIDTGKAIIRDALIGLVLLLSCVLILETINPNTSNLTPARLYNSTRPPSKSAPKPPAKSVPAK